jgi:hypothetical protein
MNELPTPPGAAGLSSPGVLDALVHDQGANRVILAMFERRPWDLGDEQLWQLQEKLNAYVSFVLDGEMAELHPELLGKPVCLQLRTVHPPSPQALKLIEQAGRQLALQDITLEVWDISEESENKGCSCC